MSNYWSIVIVIIADIYMSITIDSLPGQGFGNKYDHSEPDLLLWTLYINPIRIPQAWLDRLPEQTATVPKMDPRSNH